MVVEMHPVRAVLSDEEKNTCVLRGIAMPIRVVRGVNFQLVEQANQVWMSVLIIMSLGASWGGDTFKGLYPLLIPHADLAWEHDET